MRIVKARIIITLSLNFPQESNTDNLIVTDNYLDHLNILLCLESIRVYTTRSLIVHIFIKMLEIWRNFISDKRRIVKMF